MKQPTPREPTRWVAFGGSCQNGQVGLASCERYVIEQDLFSLTSLIATCADFGQETNAVYSLRLDTASLPYYLDGQRFIPTLDAIVSVHSPSSILSPVRP